MDQNSQATDEHSARHHHTILASLLKKSIWQYRYVFPLFLALISIWPILWYHWYSSTYHGTRVHEYTVYVRANVDPLLCATCGCFSVLGRFAEELGISASKSHPKSARKQRVKCPKVSHRWVHQFQKPRFPSTRLVCTHVYVPGTMVLEEGAAAAMAQAAARTYHMVPRYIAPTPPATKNTALMIVLTKPFL